MEPFRIDVPQPVLDDLRARLGRTRWPDALPGSGWEHGTDRDYLRELCATWADDYDWRASEARLNAFEQVRTTVDGQPIHALLGRSGRPDALPLMLLHGWPSCFAEFEKVVRPLAERFDVVVPSLPGYGFSGPTLEPGWTPARIARAFDELMRRLGHSRYGVHGGDWGAMVASQLGVQFSERVAGIHLSMVFPLRPRDGDPMEGLSDAEREAVADMYSRGSEESGYQRIQSTRPQSAAFGLADSPAGLAGWIVEKYRAWGDCGGDLESCFTRRELLDNLTIYWVTETIHSSMRLYRESALGGRGVSTPDQRVPVPMGHLRLPADGFQTPRRWAEALYDVQHWTEAPRGGHFPALEIPEILVQDVEAFFGKLAAP